jgi:peptide/nickel transport system substrate-binding protein
VAAVLAVAAPAAAQEPGAKRAFRIGWSQDPQTLNPFVALDEEDYTVWSITWDLLVAYSPEDLGPVPGLAESWEVSPDRRTVTFTLVDGATWSDGRPITSRDVKWTLDVLGRKGALFASYSDSIEEVETPDARTVVLRLSRPDARIIGGLAIYMLPELVSGASPRSS